MTVSTTHPGRLGLIESSDAGSSWSRVSLSGQVDFHSLTVVDEHVFGWDSGTGRLMVSADRVSWDTRSTLDLVSFAVDPADLDHLVAAAPGELIASTDGGRRWAPSEGPPLVALSWDETAGLWGAEAGGALWRLEEGSWAQAGQLPGTSQALLVTPDALYAAANDAEEVPVSTPQRTPDASGTSATRTPSKDAEEISPKRPKPTARRGPAT